MNTPMALIINPDSDRIKVMAEMLFEACGTPPGAYSIYAAPCQAEFPRMHPSRKSPSFDLVMIDCTVWIGDADDREAIRNRMICPTWLREDVLNELPDALVVVLHPGAPNAVKNAYGGGANVRCISKNDPDKGGQLKEFLRKSQVPQPPPDTPSLFIKICDILIRFQPQCGEMR